MPDPSQSMHELLTKLPGESLRRILGFIDYGYHPENFIKPEEDENTPLLIHVPGLIAQTREALEDILYNEEKEPVALPEMPSIELLHHEEKLTGEQKDEIRMRIRDLLYFHPFLEDAGAMEDPGGPLSSIQLTIRHLVIILAMGGEKAPAAPFDDIVLTLSAKEMRQLLVKLLAASIETLADPEQEEEEDIVQAGVILPVSDHEKSLLVMQAPEHASEYFKESMTLFHRY